MSAFLLDTHVAVWLLLDDHERMTQQALETLEDERNTIAVSAASVWEIAIKRSLGKLVIEDGWASTLSRLGFDPMPITAIHAEAVERLPWHHRDPFDRVLVAQASVERRTLISADRRLTAYDIEILW